MWTPVVSRHTKTSLRRFDEEALDLQEFDEDSAADHKNKSMLVVNTGMLARNRLRLVGRKGMRARCREGGRGVREITGQQQSRTFGQP